jgi:hypothetical protein
VFEEEVTVTKRSLRWLAPLARPVFRANHAAMMRHGRAGLTAHLRRLPDPRSMAGVSI